MYRAFFRDESPNQNLDNEKTISGKTLRNSAKEQFQFHSFVSFVTHRNLPPLPKNLPPDEKYSSRNLFICTFLLKQFWAKKLFWALRTSESSKPLDIVRSCYDLLKCPTVFLSTFLRTDLYCAHGRHMTSLSARRELHLMYVQNTTLIWFDLIWHSPRIFRVWSGDRDSSPCRSQAT